MKSNANLCKVLAQKACKFVTDGVFYQMNYCEDDYFVVEDDNGDEILVPYADVDLEEDCFYALVKMKVPIDTDWV